MSITDIARAAVAAVRYVPTLLHRIRVEQGEAYTAFATKDVASGGSLNLALSNPTDDKTIDIQSVTFIANFQGYYRVADGFSDLPSGGNGVGLDNLLMDTSGAADVGEMDVSSDVSFTESNLHTEMPLPTGGQGNNTTPTAGRGTNPLIEPGREVVFELDADDNSDGKAGIVVTYHELARVPSSDSARQALSRLRI